MANVEEALGQLDIAPEPDSPSLADLAAWQPCTDWAGLPQALLGGIFRQLLEHHASLEDIVREWQALALVCQGWLAALRSCTPLCLELGRPGHLGEAARRWLTSVPVEVLVLSKAVGWPRGADCLLLSAPAFQRHSAGALRSIMHASPDCLPLLHAFQRLKQVSIFCPDVEGEHSRTVDAAVFHQLPKLSCLTVSGHWGALDTAGLPTRLKHLALSNFNEDAAIALELPPGLRHLELLSLRADIVLLDWEDVCARCEEVSVGAASCLLGVGRQPLGRLAAEVGLHGLQQHLYKRMGAAALEGERFQEATLAFFNLALFSGPMPPERGMVPVDADDFLQTLRDDLLPAGVDVNPGLEVFPDWVRDLPSPEACFVLELVKQEAGKPASMHFTTPVTDAEVRLLTSRPVWRISWCDDPRAAQVLADPAFLAHSAHTLTDLLSVPLTPGLDLRRFPRLLSVLGLLRCEQEELGGVLRAMPRRLESLCLTAESLPGPRDFDAGLVRHLRCLKELSLFGHRRHDLAALRRRVSLIRILNPATADGEVIGRGPNYVWPERSRAGSDSDNDSESDSEDGSEAGSDSADSFGSASSELRGSSCGGSPAPAAALPPGSPAAEAEAGEAAAAAGQARRGGADDAAAAAAGSSSGDDSDDSESGSEYGDAEHYGVGASDHHAGHHHHHGGGGHGGGGGAEEERHSGAACADPYCPLHSGKSFLQISLTDPEREASSVDFSALLRAGLQMLTITLGQENPNARCTLLYDGSWRSALAALNASSVEVLELNSQAAGMAFRSSSLLYRLEGEVNLEAAMKYVLAHHADVWQVKSWNGNTAADGVLPASRGYALMRRSAMEAAEAAAAAAAAAAGRAD